MNLRRPWLEQVIAKDAAPTHGFGVSVSVAKTTRATARFIGRLSEDNSSYVRRTSDENDSAENTCEGVGARLRLWQRNLRTVLSQCANHIEHSGGMRRTVPLLTFGGWDSVMETMVLVSRSSSMRRMCVVHFAKGFRLH